MVAALTSDGRGVVTFTIDDVRTRNALSTAQLEDFDQTLADLAADAGVRVLVITGAGSTFSSGADRSELGDPDTVERTTSLLSSILTRIAEFPVPVVCRVNGAAFGAGLAVVAAADISIAVTDAVFGLPEVRFGLVAGPAAAACVARMGETAALDLILTGRRFSAGEAVRLNLIAEVVGAGELDALVDTRVGEILLGDRAALGASRRLVRSLAGQGMAERLEIASTVGELGERSVETYGRRAMAEGGIRDVDWRDVPARPRGSLPGSQLHPDLVGDVGELGRCVVTVGTFDGMHRGHAELLARTVAIARERGLPSVLLAFDPNPAEVIRPGAHPAMLTTIPRRAELAAELGIDVVRVVRFDAAVAQLEPVEFARQTLVERLHTAEVVVGANFRFGHRASGTVRDLQQMADSLGFATRTVDLVRDTNTVISATYVRSCIQAGDVALAGSALGRPHRIDGVIEHGDHRGRTLGYPTANLSFDRFAAVPADGVYAGRAVFLDEWGQTQSDAPCTAAAISVGTNPTFDGQQRRVEAHLLDRDTDLYGRRMGIEFVERLRGMVRFDGVEPLTEQMAIDVEQTRALIVG